MKYAYSPFTFVAIWLLLSALEPATGQILYVRPVGTGTQQVGQLRQVNADGTGDTAVAVPFADVLGPVPARDGTQFAVSAVDPARPNQISRNVFTVNRTTGATQNATNFLDSLDPDTLLYTYVYGFYKAFSPDGTKIAVNSYYRSGGEHSLLIFIGLTGIGWTLLFLKMKPDGHWGQVVGNLLSEWVQMAGLVFLTKRLVEVGAKM